MVLAALLLAVRAASPAPGAAPAASAPNLLLVTIDTLRADHLHAYGDTAIETPATDRLAREGVLVEDATVQIPETRPSHASLLTGRLPFEHGIRDNYAPPLDARFPTLASVLQGQGYRTAAFIGSYALASLSGLNRGFSTFDEPFSGARRGSSLYARPERPGGEVVEAALRWLRQPRRGPFFVWVHLYDPHAPYEPPAPFDRKYAGRPYDGEVAYADAQVGRLLDFLEAQGLRQRTLVVVTSDHGEGLGDHGEDEHLMFLYDSTLHVPLLLSWPGVIAPGQRVSGLFRSVDLLPSLLQLLGRPAPATSGAARGDVLRAGGRLPEAESYAESLFGSLHFGYAPLRALRAEGWKYIDAPRAELYNLKEDPGEAHNLLEVRGAVAEHLRARLRQLDQGTPPAAVVPSDPGAMERLAALGYVGGGAPRQGQGSAPDPKDKIQEYQSYTRDVQKSAALLAAGQVEAALPILTRLSKADTVSLEVDYMLGKALLRKRRYGEAVAPLEEALRLVPRFSPAYLDLARAHAESGQVEKAVQVLDRGLRLAPGDPAFQREKGILLLSGGDVSGARRLLEASRAADPQDGRTRLALSALYRDQGQVVAALAELRQAVRADPAFLDGWIALGVLEGSAGKPLEAERAFRSALKIRPDDPDALFGLAERRRRAGHAEEAVPLLEKLLAQRPDFPGAAAALEAARGSQSGTGPGLVHLRMLRTRDRSAAEALAARLAAGESFAELARTQSTDPSASRGGDLGPVPLADLGEPLRAAAQGLAPGQLSAVLETPSGFVLLKREE